MTWSVERIVQVHCEICGKASRVYVRALTEEDLNKVQVGAICHECAWGHPFTNLNNDYFV